MILVTESLARGLWPGVPMASVVGRRVRIGEVTDDLVPIAGVVGDVRAASLDRDPTPALYVPHARNRVQAMTLVIRTAREPETIAAAVRAEVLNRDRTVPVTVRTMRDVVSASVAPRRFQMVMVLLFATLALGLALIGVYGVTSYAVARQTKEIGVRIALGAQRPVLLRSVLAQGLRPVAAGLFLGLPAAVAAATDAESSVRDWAAGSRCSLRDVGCAAGYGGDSVLPACSACGTGRCCGRTARRVTASARAVTTLRFGSGRRLSAIAFKALQSSSWTFFLCD